MLLGHSTNGLPEPGTELLLQAPHPPTSEELTLVLWKLQSSAAKDPILVTPLGPILG